MAKFLEAEARILLKKICMKCSASNPVSAVRCRRCGSDELRSKSREVKKR